MRGTFLAVILALSGCSVSTTPCAQADGGTIGDAPLSCADVWQHFSTREADFRATCQHVRSFSPTDFGCLNGTHPSAEQLASCGALFDAATSCESLADAMRFCEGGSISASACADVVHAYDVARQPLGCTYSWHSCPSGDSQACVDAIHAATSCAELDAATAACAQ